MPLKWRSHRFLRVSEGCTADLEEALAAAQATTIPAQIREEARETDLISNINIQSEVSAFCPRSGASLRPKTSRPTCHAEVEASAKFCAECGTRVAWARLGP